MTKRRNRNDDDASIIARMEAQFPETRSGSVASSNLAAHYWHGEVLGLIAHDAIVPVVEGSNSELRFWKTKPHRESGSEVAAERLARLWIARTRERNLATALLATTSPALDGFIVKWVDTVSRDKRTKLELDLSYALARLQLIFAGDQGQIWMESFNYDLNARPIDILRERGPAEVIEAIDAEQFGAL